MLVYQRVVHQSTGLKAAQKPGLQQSGDSHIVTWAPEKNAGKHDDAPVELGYLPWYLPHYSPFFGPCSQDMVMIFFGMND